MVSFDASKRNGLKIMNNTCKGCGHPLQNDHPYLEGYSPKVGADYCQSCFRYKHYKDTSSIQRAVPKYTNQSYEGMVLWCVDAMYVEESLQRINHHWLQEDFIMILTKMDVYPTDLWHTRIEQIQSLCRRHRIHPLYIIPFSKHLSWTLEHVHAAMKASNQQLFSIIGLVNVGKSSCVNALLGESSLLTSPFAHTTQAPIRRTLGEWTLIDYPGFDVSEHPYDTLSKDLVEKIQINGLIKPITYALKRSCVIVVEDAFWVECQITQPSSCTLYMSDTLTSSKRNLQVLQSNPFSQSETYTGSVDVQITHVGWMHLVGEGATFTVHTLDSLQQKQTKDALCW